MHKDLASPKMFWQITFAFAVATLLMSAILLPMFPAQSAVDTSGYGSPIFAFEMAQTPADMHAIFGTNDDPVRANRIAMMDKGNLWDFGYMFLYAMFLALFSYAAYRSSNSSWLLVSAVLGLSSGIFDAVENLILLKLSANFYSLELLNALWMPVYAKFTAIVLSCFCAAAYIFQVSNKTWRIIALVAMIASISSFVALYLPAQYGWILKYTIALSWLPMLVFSGWYSFTKK